MAAAEFSILMEGPQQWDLQALALHDITALLTSDDLHAGSVRHVLQYQHCTYHSQEHDVLHALAIWVAADPTRGQHLPTLLRAVRLHPAALCSHLESPAAHAIAPASTRSLLLHAARGLAAGVTRSQTAGASHTSGSESTMAEGCWWVSPRRAMAARLLVAGGRDEQWRPLRLVELFGQTGTWETRASLPSACPIAAAVSWEGRAYLVAGSAHSSTVLQYDAHTDAWRDGAKMGINRVNLALAGVTDTLFALV